MLPLIIGGALAGGTALANYFGNEANAEALSDAYDRISGQASEAVAANQRDINAYRNLVADTYGKGAAGYDQALQNFLDSDVYQNKDFAFTGDVSDYMDPYANQRVQAAMDAINTSAATGGSRFSSDYISRVGAKQQALSSEEWAKAYDKLMAARNQAMNEWNANSQNGWNNYNAQQQRMQAAVNAYGNDRNQYTQGISDATMASMNNRLGGLNTQAQTIMGGAQALQGTGAANAIGTGLNTAATFLGSYYGGRGSLTNGGK